MRVVLLGKKVPTGTWTMTIGGHRGYKLPPMGDWFQLDADPAHVAREREKARALRKTAWWQRRVARGICAYCAAAFAPAELTMDHVVPVARGGRSVKGNVVAACKACNTKKKLMTPAEQLLLKTHDSED
jgi:5-methylcytosine-specific restriction protein A